MTLTATVPAGSTDPVQIEGIAGAQLGFGYYKLTETESNDAYMQKSIKVGNNTYTTTDPLYIHINTNGTVEYSTSYRSGYTASTAGATVINEAIPTREISVKKVWNDDGNRDGIRPESVEVHLLKNNGHFGTYAILSADNNWEASWTAPTVDHKGNAVSYHVEEVVPAGYTEEVSGSADTGLVVTNNHESEKTNVVVHKVWNDDDNREDERPSSIRVQLYAGGVANGEEIKWTIEEVEIPKYYIASYNQDELTVTNYLQSKDIPKTGDYSQLGLWAGMLAAFTAGAAAILILGKKKKEQE